MVTIQIKLTREQLEEKRLVAQEKGFAITADAGEVEAKGVKVGYHYDEGNALLTVIVEHVSFADKIAGYNEEKVAGMLKEMLTPDASGSLPA